MKYRIQRVSEVSTHAFRDLIILWLAIVFFTVIAAILMSSTSAKANDLQSLSPPSALIQGRCHAHLHPQHNGTLHSNVTDRTQRNAETQGPQQQI